MPVFGIPFLILRRKTMFKVNVRKFQTGAELNELIKQFQEFKKSYKEIMPGKTLEIVDMKIDICDAIYYKVKEKNNGANHIANM